MMSIGYNSGNVYLKCTNFRMYMLFANFGGFCKIKYKQNFLLNSICENKYTLNKDAQNLYFTKYKKKKNMHKINSAKFLESINNRLIINQYKL